jgi:hypothetical protein
MLIVAGLNWLTPVTRQAWQLPVGGVARKR